MLEDPPNTSCSFKGRGSRCFRPRTSILYNVPESIGVEAQAKSLIYRLKSILEQVSLALAYQPEKSRPMIPAKKEFDIKKEGFE